MTSTKKTKKKIELLEMAIESVKKLGKPNDSNMVCIKDPKDGKITIVLLATGKNQQKLAMEMFRKTHNDPEMVFVANGWMSHCTEEQRKSGNFVKRSEDPKRKECFVLNYFSPTKKELSHTLVYESKKGNTLKWIDELHYKDTTDVSSAFNPYKFTKEQIRAWLEESKIDSFKEKATKEEHELPHKFKVIVYRKDTEFCFETINAKGEAFGRTGIMESTEETEEKLKTAISMLKNPSEAINFLNKSKKAGGK